MKDPLDPRIDMMMASLYGELSAEDEARFQAMLEQDAALRAEWEDLRTTRRLLSSWDLEDRAPSFVLLPSAAERTASNSEPASSVPQRSDTGFWAALRAGWRRQTAMTGWAVAAAAVLLAVLAFAEFRVQLLDGGIAFRFGPPTAERIGEESPLESQDRTPALTNGVSPSVPQRQGELAHGGDTPANASDPAQGDPARADLAQNEPWIATGPDSTRIHLTRNMGDPSAPLTRGEFDGYVNAMAKLMAAIQDQNEYNAQENQEFIMFMRTMYEGLNEKQSQDYYDLRGRIEAVRYGLNEVETSTNDRLDSIDLSQGRSLTPQGSWRAPSRSADADSVRVGEDGRDE